MASLPSRVRQLLAAVGPVPDGGEARLDDVAAANVNPVLRRKLVERERAARSSAKQSSAGRSGFWRSLGVGGIRAMGHASDEDMSS